MKIIKKLFLVGSFLYLSTIAVTIQAEIKVALQADTSKFLARCNNCIPKGAKANNAFVHADSLQPAYAQFVLEKLENGKYALKSDTGAYLARCRNCVPGGAYPDNAGVHVSSDKLPTAPYAQFELTRLENGKYTLKADTGNYLARCNNCIPGGAYPDSAFIHVSKDKVKTAPYAQWDIIIIP